MFLSETQKDEGQEKHEGLGRGEPSSLRHRETVLLTTQNLSKKFGTMRATKSKRLVRVLPHNKQFVV